MTGNMVATTLEEGVCKAVGRRHGGIQMKPKKKQGLTTEEVSRVLDVSITTVIRYFNEGILTGWKNPINGRVVIDPKSVNALVALTQKRAVTVRQAVDDFIRRGYKKG